jgi:proteasome lid subunit RPN8/RPN11
VSSSLLEIRREVWNRLVDDLARTGKGTRESGAFLLGASEQRRVVTDYLLYHEVAPESQHVDYVLLRGPDMARVWEECERRELFVIADVHTHPGAPAQSRSDRHHPIICIPGHVALIIPRFAQGLVPIDSLGLHRFLGSGCWESWFGPDVTSRLQLI